MLVGVNVGPNLTYVGSLATLLWRRIVHAHDEDDRHRRVHAAGGEDRPGLLLASTVALVVGSAGPVMRAVIWIPRTPGRLASTSAARCCPPTPRSRCCTSRRATSRSSPRAARARLLGRRRRRLRAPRCERSPTRRPRRCSRRRASALGAAGGGRRAPRARRARGGRACADADLLVLARDGERARLGPRASGRARASSSTTRRVRCWSCGR